MGNVHLLFIYKPAMPHHVKLTPSVGSCLSCFHQPSQPPASRQHCCAGFGLLALGNLPAEVMLVLSWSAKIVPLERTCRKQSLQGFGAEEMSD